MPTAPPDISRFRDGNTGVPYVWQFGSRSPGPHVLITAIVHGNEISGAMALARFVSCGFTVDRGRVTVAFANTDAYAIADPGHPWKGRCVDEDMNRLWTAARLAGRGTTTELRRAQSLQPLVDQADLLLDLHSMHQAGGPLVLAGPLDKGLRLARATGLAPTIIRDSGHVAGTRLRDYGQFGDPAHPATALLVECGQHRDPVAADVAWRAIWRVLDVAGVSDHARTMHPPPEAVTSPTVVEVTQTVTAQTEHFRFVRPVAGIEQVPARGTLVATDGFKDVRTPYDDCVLVMPSSRPAPGHTAVRLGRVVA